ncbi:pectate lyase family protein [Hamadaea tsunoensis]|uniref:pectate lyase family protein n=1 Tax=Hamadaea tsunoensis TaxID=53368 RepID=UPI00055149AA|nr:pectate lyase [Hamadaea tsunoensis]
MRHLRSTAVLAAVLMGSTALAAAPAAAAGTPSGWDWGRATLPAGDGWAADGTGTTGGSAADADHVFVAATRAELVAALGGDNATNKLNATPKIIYLRGTINGFEGADGARLTCADLADPAYSLDAYLAAYDPAVWGRGKLTGPQEEARIRSVANQTAQTQINVGPNTTIVGLPGAHLDELTLMLDGASNSIVRNVTFADAHDCAPAWSPTDGADGNWNSQFDLLSVRRSEHVWLDHNTFGDGGNPDSDQPVYFGRPYQVHDGATDLTHTSNLLTVSWNRYADHDKVMLIGSTDSTTGGDPGRLKVTVHHNYFSGTIQRLPRVRFGQVDIYDNVYRLDGAQFDYAIGIGVQSAVYAENNYFALTDGSDPAALLHNWGGTALTEKGSWVSVGRALPKPVSLVSAYNAANDPDFGTDAGWTPTLRAGPVLPAPLAALTVPFLAGSH